MKLAASLLSISLLASCNSETPILSKSKNDKNIKDATTSCSMTNGSTIFCDNNFSFTIPSQLSALAEVKNCKTLISKKGAETDCLNGFHFSFTFAKNLLEKDHGKCTSNGSSFSCDLGSGFKVFSLPEKTQTKTEASEEKVEDKKSDEILPEPLEPSAEVIDLGEDSVVVLKSSSDTTADTTAVATETKAEESKETSDEQLEENNTSSDSNSTKEDHAAEIKNPGLLAHVYKISDSTRQLPDFSLLTEATTSVVSQIDMYSGNSSKDYFGLPASVYGSWTAIKFNGKILVPSCLQDSCLYRLVSDDGAKLFINGDLIINNDGYHASSALVGALSLSEGLYDVELQWFQGPGDMSLALELSNDGGASWSLVDSNSLSH